MSSELQEIRKELATISNQLSALSASLEERCTGHQNTIHEHHATLYGNGHPGIKTRLQRLEDHCGLLFWVIAAVSTCVIGVIVEIVVTLIKAETSQPKPSASSAIEIYQDPPA